LADGSRVGLEGLREFHGGIALVVAELFISAGIDPQVDVGKIHFGKAAGEGFGAPVGELFFDQLDFFAHVCLFPEK